MTIEEAFGFVLKRLRRERNYSQEKLSALSSLDRKFISQIERGRQQPSLMSIVALGNALNVIPSRIVFEAEFLLKSNHPDLFGRKYNACELNWTRPMEHMMKELYDEFNGSETILLVDDDMQVLEMMSNIVKDCGYNVINANDGVEAIEKYKLNIAEIKIVIMDIVMPRKDGITAFHEIMEINPNAVVILISGFHDGQLALSDKLKIIQKPFLPTDFLRHIRNSLDAQ